MNESVDNDPSHLLLMQLSSAGHWANSRLDATLSARGLSAAKLSILRELCKSSEPLPLGQLAERLTCAKSNVTQLVDRLEHEGLVRRLPYPDDRRCVRATVTEEGRRRCEWGLQAESEVEQELFKKLSESKKEHLASLLAEIHVETD
jgi:DNA-binding MarR family transcriptional regulator